jgi:hypothetical protein
MAETATTSKDKPRTRAKTRNKDSRLHKLTRMGFTDLGIRNLNVTKRLAEINKERVNQGLKELNQVQIWDTGQKGLSLLISSGGTKTFRATFKLNGKWVSTELGRFRELIKKDREDDDEENIEIAEARRLTASRKRPASILASQPTRQTEKRQDRNSRPMPKWSRSSSPITRSRVSTPGIRRNASCAPALPS